MFLGSGPHFSPYTCKGQITGPDPALLNSRMEFSLEHTTVDPGSELIRTRLHKRYGTPIEPQRLEPIDELVRTILSQNTNDRNSDISYRALKDRFRGWEDVLEVPAEELASIIAPAGLGPTKSRRIHDILRKVYVEGEGDFLDLCALPVEKAMQRLLSLSGVGPKTAACVLLFSCRYPVFPVDTHIYRVAGRLGLLPDGSDRVKAHEVLGKTFPPEHYLELHLNMIRLGREVCRPSRPLCGECLMGDVCPSAQKVS
jgi:endonuclease-3